jgi:hypothetical protein
MSSSGVPEKSVDQGTLIAPGTTITATATIATAIVRHIPPTARSQQNREAIEWEGTSATAGTLVIAGNAINIRSTCNSKDRYLRDFRKRRDPKNTSRRKNIDTSRLNNNNNKTSSTSMLRATTGMPGKKERHKQQEHRNKRKANKSRNACNSKSASKTGGLIIGLDR